MNSLLKKLFLACFYYTLAGFVACYGATLKSASDTKKIGIIMPIEHQALLEISAGFQKTLKNLYPGPIEFKVSNAQGDINLERAIISQMRDANYDLIVPIATQAVQMAAAMIREQPIVGLAANSLTNGNTKKNDNLVIVKDELDKEKIIAFIHKVYPKLKNLSLVYSSSDKIFSEAAQVEVACKHRNIKLHRLMIQNLSDLYSVSQAIPQNTEAVFILKDNLVASGISTLVQATKKRNIPLITSDESTVQQGASFAVGVSEKDIGVEGAKLAVQILQGTHPSKLSMVELTKPTIFVNRSSLVQLGQDLALVKSATKALHYSFIIKPE